MSIPFYEFPSSPILIIGALGIAVAIIVFFCRISKIFEFTFEQRTYKNKRGLIMEQKELNERLEKIEQDLKNL
ncbi:hypothetical protein EU92_0319 [Prochlorococcus marinus str. MIT 9107]|uniref:Uncharacterized protein n=1 Tax=Prochlorococcus marinus str. MIT 9116 TaxID=167544 RepID=A0A0A1ZWN7_PROMR|nr:M protein [Prochlorococcus marinus]KGF91577.1 hypothetical protein EU92_0319 [Prochlorococcus marinus str. MIT 9107]KGF93820.1 hypothetical protein EU93_0014 [Prochlorococcus marinus str. MIT 9116]KGF94170.1 hypothetical protein EU94_0757 [Prochlorococcus marinus str. MIT 9123]